MTFEWTAADEAGLSGLEPAYTSGIPGSVSWVCVRLRAALAELQRRDAMRAPKLPIARWEAPAGSATPEGYVFAATPPTPAPAAIADMVANQADLDVETKRALADRWGLYVSGPTSAAGPTSPDLAEVPPITREELEAARSRWRKELSLIWHPPAAGPADTMRLDWLEYHSGISTILGPAELRSWAMPYLPVDSDGLRGAIDAAMKRDAALNSQAKRSCRTCGPMAPGMEHGPECREQR